MSISPNLTTTEKRKKKRILPYRKKNLGNNSWNCDTYTFYHFLSLVLGHPSTALLSSKVDGIVLVHVLGNDET